MEELGHEESRFHFVRAVSGLNRVRLVNSGCVWCIDWSVMRWLACWQLSVSFCPLDGWAAAALLIAAKRLFHFV